MIYALVDNNRIRPQKGLKGTCPLCGANVIAKCGEIYTHYWAHKKGEACEDNWHEKETTWHLGWKLIFGKENTEVVIIKNGKRHFADIQSLDGVIIEIQNSPIKSTVITEREEFYGKRMMWIINGFHFRENFNFPHKHFEPQKVKKRFLQIDRKKTIEPPKTISFRWEYPRTTWGYAKRPVFIDFGDERIYRIIEGLGTGYCTGKEFSKRQYIEKYGGDYELYKQNFMQSLDEIIREENRQINEAWRKFIGRRRSNFRF